MAETIGVYYGPVEDSQHSYVVVRTSAEEIQYYDNLYEPCACEYQVLFELSPEDMEKWNVPPQESPGWASSLAEQLVLKAWHEQESTKGNAGEVETKVPSEGDTEEREWAQVQDPKNMSLDLHEAAIENQEEEGEGDQDEEVEDGQGPLHQLLITLAARDFSHLPEAGDLEEFDLKQHFDRVSFEAQGIQTLLTQLLEECLALHDPTDIARVVLEGDNHSANMLIVSVLRQLFHRGADPSVTGGVNQAAMPIVAAEWGDGKFLEELLEAGCNIDHRGPNGMTVTHFLVSNLGNLDPRRLGQVVRAAQMLLSLEPNLSLRSHTQDTVLQVLENGIELGGPGFLPGQPPREVWELCALFQQAFSEFETLPCLKCGRPAALARCSRCEVVRYCSPECQRQHWKFHKHVCVEARS